ncbi:MAG: RNA polymerase sigma factor [Gaiellaceae bacterium]
MSSPIVCSGGRPVKATARRSAFCSSGTPPGSTTLLPPHRRLGSGRGSDVATFLLAWRSRGRAPLQAESALPLLYGIATNALRNHRRSLKRHRDAFGRLPLERAEEPDFAEKGAIRLDDQVAMRRLLSLFARLPRRQQDVVAQCDWSGLSYEDAAVALDIPIGTVRSRLARGRRRLRELATTSGPEGDVDVVPLRIEVNEQ